MEVKNKLSLMVLMFLKVFLAQAQTEVKNTHPKVRLSITNAAGSKVNLLQIVNEKTRIVDSVVINSNDTTVTLNGASVKEELQAQLIIRDKNKRMFVLYPVLDNNRTPEIYIDLKQAFNDEKAYLDKFRFENSPSSVDWNTLFYFPADWARAKSKLEKQFKNSMTVGARKEIDSLASLIKDYTVAMLRKTESVATVYSGLNWLKFGFSDDNFDELLDELERKFSSSEIVKNKLKWFRLTKKYVPPTGEILNNGIASIDFTFNTIEGGVQKLSAYKGNYVMLDFWASWCKPCRDESPFLKRAYQKYRDKGFKIIQVSIDNAIDEKKWKAAIQEDGTNLFIHTRKEKNDPLIKAYKVAAIPVSYLIDPNGKIIASNLRGNDLEAKLAEIYR
ncbi:peroxiredoxin family protein [Pedobacter sp.]